MFATTLGINFVEFLPGRFLMGSPADEIGREADEQQHQVTLTEGFWMADAPTTNNQYRYMNPSHSSGSLYGLDLDVGEYPCTGVSLVEAKAFCDWLSAQDSKWHYQLPSEAEWEYAARGGTIHRFPWGEDESQAEKFANTFDISAMKALPSLPADGFDVDDGFVGPSPVRYFKCNQFGLYDVIGNVWEMCRNVAYKFPAEPLVDPQGPAQGRLYGVRGGDWLSIPFFSRLANRTFTLADDKSETVGFRIMAKPKIKKPIADIVQRPIPTWHDVSSLFTSTDIDHMKAASAKWKPPLELDSYDSVRHYAMKVYSSVRTDRMPVDPVPLWTPDMKALFRNWIYAGCPK